MKTTLQKNSCGKLGTGTERKKNGSKVREVLLHEEFGHVTVDFSRPWNRSTIMDSFLYIILFKNLNT